MPRIRIKEKVRTTALGLAIVLGVIVHGSRAHAGEIRGTAVAGGCFLCVESDFESVPGVVGVVAELWGDAAPLAGDH